MGQALYRKYRSKSLSEIVGQEHVTQTLDRAIKAGKISHAYLLTGPRGVGKTSIARILAHEINGLPYTDESIHLDIIEIDAASNRRIDEIRDLRDKVHIAPTSAKYKVYIIDEVHMLTKEAFNALLKTLEEPPAHVVFILATTEAHKLPETIISRTQRFTFKAIDPEVAVKHLKTIAKKEKMQIDDDALALLAEHGGGSFRDAIGLLDQVGHSKDKVTKKDVELLIGIAPEAAIHALLDATMSGVPSEIVRTLDTFTEQGISPSQVAKQLAALVRGQLLAQTFKGTHMKAIDLLSALLNIPASSHPGSALELALFNVAPLEQTESYTKHKPASSNPTPTKSVKDTPKQHPDSDIIAAESAEISPEPAIKVENTSSEVIEPTFATEDISAWWSDLVSSIKKHNNTLYGVLRMAHPALIDDTLRLGFAYNLHTKKIADAGTSHKLQEAVKTLTGRDVNIEAYQDKDLKDKEPDLTYAPAQTTDKLASENKTNTSKGLEAITSIFGGGEVLES